MLFSVFFAAAFVYVGTGVRVDGWRTAWIRVAIGLIVVAAPIVLLLQEPRALGKRDELHADEGDARDRGATLADALRTPAFWIFAGATSLFGLVSSGLGLFNEAVLAERGFPQATYVDFVTWTFLVGLAGQFACGWLTLRWPLARLLALAMGLYGVALVALPFVTTPAHVWSVAILIGLSGGMVTVLFFAVWGATFGQAHLGRIQGAAQMLTVLASAVGPLIFAKGYALTGSYAPPLWLLAPCVAAIGGAALLLRTERPAY